MRTLLIGTFAAALAVLAGCGEQKVVTTTTKSEKPPSLADAQQAAQESIQAGEEANAENTPPPTLRVGDTATIGGNDDGETMDVKLVGIVDDFSGGEYDSPKAGYRYVGVKLRLTNSGVTTYDDSPSNGAALIGSNDENADDASLYDNPNCSDPSSLKISAGTSRNICLPFEMKQGVRPKTFQFTLDSGFGDETAEFQLQR